MPRRDRAARCRRSIGVAQVLIFGARNMPCASSSTPMRWPPRASASTRSQRRRRRGQRQHAGRHDAAASQRQITTSRRNDPADRRRRLPRPHRRHQATRRSACGDVARVIDSVENDQHRQLVQRRALASCWPCSASPTPTPSTSSTASRRCCRSLQASCRPASASTCSTTARSRSAPPSHDVQLTLTLTIGAGRPGHLPVPAPPVGDHHPGPGGAGLADRAPSARMYLLGFSIDNISLLGLTLSVGLVVDDAIVMLENIVRHVEDGMRAVRGRAQGQRARSASPSCRSRCRWSPCSSRSCSWAASSAGCSTSSPWW